MSSVRHHRTGVYMPKVGLADEDVASNDRKYVDGLHVSPYADTNMHLESPI